MEREIKFRGKTKDGGEWLYGDLARVYNYDTSEANEWNFAIKPLEGQIVEVASETVGQFIGLRDKHGVEIFEKDRVRFTDLYDSIHAPEERPILEGVVQFRDGSFVIKGEYFTSYRWMDYEIEVIN